MQSQLHCWSTYFVQSSKLVAYALEVTYKTYVDNIIYKKLIYLIANHT